MHRLAQICFLLFFSSSCFSQAKNNTEPKIFLPGIVSTGLNERDMAISPDGKDMYYTIQSPRMGFSVIVHRVMENNLWKDASTAFFSGQFEDLEPAFSPDGKKLFFVSNRPLIAGGKTKDFDIWYMEKTAVGWGKPINAGPNVNSDNNEFYPSVTIDGSVYFTAIRADTLGQEDIYKSQWTNNQFEKAVNIGNGVNSSFDEYNAYIDPNERFIIFSVEGAIEGYIGRGDLCISYHAADGSWTKAKTLGSKINSDRLDYCPFIYHNLFYFTSERVGRLNTKVSNSSLKEIKNILDKPGNGYGDIYFIPVEEIIDAEKLKAKS